MTNGNLKKLVNYNNTKPSTNWNVENHKKQKLLHLAAISGQQASVDFLLKYFGQSDIDKEDSSGSTALHCASENGHIEIVQILNDRGANVDKENIDRMTPLHTASKKKLFKHCQIFGSKRSRN